MSIVEIKDNIAYLKCDVCGSEFCVKCKYELPRDNNDFFSSFFFAAIEKQKCNKCVNELNEKIRKEKEQIAQYDHEQEMPHLLKLAGIPEKYLNIERDVPNKKMANHLYLCRNDNLFITGTPGSGKTTSCIAILIRVIRKDWIRVKYTTLLRLVSEWKNVKKGDYKLKKGIDDITSWMEYLNENYDIICVDEFGFTGMKDENINDLVFSLVDAVSSGEAKFKLWLVGNTKKSFLNTMFFVPTAVSRRINDNFTSIFIDGNCSECTMKKIQFSSISSSKGFDDDIEG